MKRKTKASAVLLVAVALIAGGCPASAAEEKFPDIPGAPSWYVVAPNAPYARNDAPTGDQYSVQDDVQWHAAAWWFSPEGSAPSPGEPDIIIETLPKAEQEVGATDPNLITLSINAAFPELTDSIGTEFTTGIALPMDQPGAGPVLTFPGDGIIVAQRPARDCLVTNDIKDPDRFTMNVAMLGANQNKYLVQFTVEYGVRTWNDACARALPVQAAEETPEPEFEKAVETDASGAGATGVTQDSAQADSAASDTRGTLITILVLAVLALAVSLALLFRRRGPAFLNDGTPIHGNDTNGREAPFGTPAKRSEFGG